MESGREKRQDERRDANTIVRFQVPGTDVAGKGRIEDTSATGLKLRAGCAIEPGTMVSIRVPRGGAYPPVVTAVRVVRCESSGGAYAIGCALD